MGKKDERIFIIKLGDDWYARIECGGGNGGMVNSFVATLVISTRMIISNSKMIPVMSLEIELGPFHSQTIPAYHPSLCFVCTGVLHANVNPKIMSCNIFPP